MDKKNKFKNLFLKNILKLLTPFYMYIEKHTLRETK